MHRDAAGGGEQELSAWAQWHTHRRETRARRRRERPPNNYVVIALGTIAMIGVALALLASLINLWPNVEASATNTPTTTTAAVSAATATHTVRLFFALVTVHATPGTALLLLVIVVGALGSLIQAATSFGDFVGNRRFYSSWGVWYLLRLIVGVLLALLFYFVVRGGFFSGSSQASSVNPYGIAAIAGLAGLFSKQATDKLREVFETLFRVSSTAGDAQRRDDLANAKPTVTSIEPTQVNVGASQVRVMIHGEHFIDKLSVVKLGGVAQPSTFVSAKQLDFVLPDVALAQPGALEIVVCNPPPGGGDSEPPVSLAIVTPPTA